MTHAPRPYTAAACILAALAILSCSGDQQGATTDTLTADREQQVATTDTLTADPGQQVAAIDPASIDHSDLITIPTSERTAEQDYLLGRHFAVRGQADQAFEALADALLKGFDDTTRLTQDQALAVLHPDSRWEQVLVYTETNLASPPTRPPAAPRRAQNQQPRRPPAARINIPAPDWTLTDAEGKLVRLSNLRGKVVVMDFWATWCGPCKRSMPQIDEFVRKHAGKDVVVFSVNVWERDPRAARIWWNAQGYAMGLLFGDRSLTNAYGVQGIPHLCVIDADGIIRRSEAGYHPGLLNNLIRWTRELTTST